MDYTDTLYSKFANDPLALDAELSEDVKIDRSDVAKTMMTHAETYLKWARLAAKAEKLYAEQDRMINLIIWPRSREIARNQLNAQGIKITERALDDLAGQSTEYQEAVAIRADRHALLEVFKKAETAMFQRKDLLVALCYRQNKELASLPN